MSRALLGIGRLGRSPRVAPWLFASALPALIHLVSQPSAAETRGDVPAKESRAQVTLATDELPKGAVWDASELQGIYRVLDVAVDRAARRVSWTVSESPRHGPNFNFHVRLYDRLGRPLLEAPLSWSQGRGATGPVRFASLDLAWLVRRLASRASDVALIAVQRVEPRKYGRPRQVPPAAERLKRLPSRFMTKSLPEAVVWDLAGFHHGYEVLDASMDQGAGRVVWQLEPLPRVYASRALEAVCYDAAGKPLAELPLLWSDGRRDGSSIDVAELDVGYLAGVLKERARDVARIGIRRVSE